MILVLDTKLKYKILRFTLRKTALNIFFKGYLFKFTSKRLRQIATYFMFGLKGLQKQQPNAEIHASNTFQLF